jgi:hypothetical protein
MEFPAIRRSALVTFHHLSKQDFLLLCFPSMNECQLVIFFPVPRMKKSSNKQGKVYGREPLCCWALFPVGMARTLARLPYILFFLTFFSSFHGFFFKKIKKRTKGRNGKRKLKRNKDIWSVRPHLCVLCTARHHTFLEPSLLLIFPSSTIVTRLKLLCFKLYAGNFCTTVGTLSFRWDVPASRCVASFLLKKIKRKAD